MYFLPHYLLLTLCQETQKKKQKKVGKVLGWGGGVGWGFGLEYIFEMKNDQCT